MIFLGIDGGGSKTTCLVGDENSILGNGSDGPSNVIRVGEIETRASLNDAIQQACAAAGVSPARIHRTCVGLAGAARPEISSVARRLLSEIVSGEVEIVGDTITALAAAFGSGPGVIVIAGTGSIAYGRNAAGETMRAGGWGFAISDEGSGHWIGRAAVTAAMRSLDENGRSPLFERILETWKLESRDELVVAANATPPPDFATLVPLVLSAADAGDVTACTILENAGAELAWVAKIVISRLFQGESRPRVAMSGGVFQNSALVREHFYKILRSAYAGVSISDDIVDPVRGALELARKG
ncbi:MAG TPA: BadF/BadG/BcrA/BcrD ATPase family protein [Terriglobales bacterium]|nr:BadF/BadG/BcrA/BcrD ATPase family protein [Terriglobales bacterium]